jgi:hypothetical protein
MSGTVSPGREAGQQAAGQRAEAMAAAEAGGARRRRRGGLAAAGLVVLAAAGAAAAWQAGVFPQAASPGTGQGAPPPATEPVVREDIAAATPVNATLGYAGSWTVRGQGGGTLTWLPQAGQVIRQGRALYQTGNGSPVVLLYGKVPDWRTLDEGETGADVTQLNHDLVNLGYASSGDVSALGWDYYSFQTANAVVLLEDHLGVSSPSGSLSLGSVVFEPEALRVSSVLGSLGGPASGPVLAATSDRHVVTIALDAALQSDVRAGDSATVTLPDGSSTPGVITSVGTVATGSGGSATIPVYVRLTRPGAAGMLDEAPVTVNITTATARSALVVPVAALLAQVQGDGEAGGGYAVEVAGAGDARHLVPVTPGIFDDADGMVEVSGALTPGQRVVVPAT